jgi:hypothetical protein
MTITMRTSAIIVAAICLFASLSHGTNALVVQPPSVSTLSVKPAATVPSLRPRVANKSKRPSKRRIILIQPAEYEAAIVSVYPYDPTESNESCITDEPVPSDWKRVGSTVKLVVIILFCCCLAQPRQQAQIGGAMVYSIGLRSYRDIPPVV